MTAQEARELIPGKSLVSWKGRTKNIGRFVRTTYPGKNKPMKNIIVFHNNTEKSIPLSKCTEVK